MATVRVTSPSCTKGVTPTSLYTTPSALAAAVSMSSIAMAILRNLRVFIC